MVCVITGYPRNPQTESLLKFLEVPYLLDDMFDSAGPSGSSVPFSDSGKTIYLMLWFICCSITSENK